MPDTEDSYPIVLFDGVCNLCHHMVQWIIHHDQAGNHSGCATPFIAGSLKIVTVGLAKRKAASFLQRK